jgi:hypothetical protein
MQDFKIHSELKKFELGLCFERARGFKPRR